MTRIVVGMQAVFSQRLASSVQRCKGAEREDPRQHILGAPSELPLLRGNLLTLWRTVEQAVEAIETVTQSF